MTATDRGVNSRATDAASAMCSRCSAAANDRSEGSMSSSTSITDDSTWVTSSKPADAEDVEHRPVGGQHRGVEAGDPVLPGRRRQVLQQQRPESPVLELVGHHEGGFGRVGVLQPFVASHRHDPLAPRGHQRHPVVVVDRGEVLDLGGAQRGVGREEPVLDRLGRQSLVEGPQPIGVLGRDGPDVHRLAVHQDDIGFPVGRRGARDEVEGRSGFSPAGGCGAWRTSGRCGPGPGPGHRPGAPGW